MDFFCVLKEKLCPMTSFRSLYVSLCSSHVKKFSRKKCQSIIYCFKNECNVLNDRMIKRLILLDF